MSDLHIQIGPHQMEFDLYTTTAPADYDSASTITVYEDKDKRFILVDVRMIGWHEGRYASGLHRFDKEESDQSILNYVAGKLVDRLHLREAT